MAGKHWSYSCAAAGTGCLPQGRDLTRNPNRARTAQPCTATPEASLGIEIARDLPGTNICSARSKFFTRPIADRGFCGYFVTVTIRA